MMDIKYVPAISGIDWNDMQSLLVLSDAEEERGNTIAASALRYLYKAHRKPNKSLTLKTEVDGRIVSGVSYDWTAIEKHPSTYSPKYFLPTPSVNCSIPQQIVNQLPLMDDVAYDLYNDVEVGEDREWVGYWRLEDAYLAFIDTCIVMNVEIIYDTVENIVYLINHS